MTEDRGATGETAGPGLPVTLPLPGGGTLTVRSVRTEDVDALILLYAGLSDTDRHRRFFSRFRTTRAWVVDWVSRCQERGANIVAEVTETGELVGEAAYVLQANGNGDFSLTVDAAWRGWLGPYLLDVLVEQAAADGVPNLEADILTENRPMQAIVGRRGAVVGAESDRIVVHVVFGTRERTARWGEGHRRSRVLVEASGGRWGRASDVERAGYEVLGCPGPGRRHEPCPALAGEPCPLAATADAIVVAMPSGSADELAVAHRRLHPDVPVVVLGAPDALGTDDAGDTSTACRLAAGTTSGELLAAIDRLVRGDRGSAPSARRPST